MPINFFDGYCVSPKPSYRLKLLLMLSKFVLMCHPLSLQTTNPDVTAETRTKLFVQTSKNDACDLERLRRPTFTGDLRRFLRDRLTKYKNSQQLRHRPTITANFPQLEGSSHFLGS